MNTYDLAHTASDEFADLSDEELAGAAAVGDSQAFTALIRRTLPGLLNFVRRLIGDGQIVEDVAQETLLDAWRKLPDFEFRSSFRTWLFAIAYRRTADYHRRRHDVPIDDDQLTDLPAVTALPSQVAEQSLLVDALRVELDSLPHNARAAWWLKEVEGLSINEISLILRISTGSVRGHLQRSRKFLAVRLAHWNPDAASSERDGFVGKGGTTS